MKGEMQIGEVTFHDDGTNFVVNIKVRNTSDRTLHVYADARKMEYDAATKTLIISLADQETNTELLTGNFVLPRLTTVDAHGEGVITLKLPRIMTRMLPGANQISPSFEQLPIHEAQTVEVRVAWSETPFYPDPRKQREHVSVQLQNWASGIAQGRGTREAKPDSR